MRIPMKGDAGFWNVRLVPFLLLFCLVCLVILAAPAPAQPTKGGSAGDDAEMTNPYLGDAQAIEEGERIFRRRCVGCHWSPKRGPDLFQTEISDEKFLMTVINGRTGGRAPMPPFGYVLSPDDVWKVHAFVEANDRL